MSELNIPTQPLTYSANDWFYMKTKPGEECDPTDTYNKTKCDANRNNVNNLRSSTDSLGASIMQYNDARMLYNRELLFSINIIAGLVLICYYIYRNQSVFPNPTTAISSISKIGDSLSNATSSLKNRLSMSPNLGAAAAAK